MHCKSNDCFFTRNATLGLNGLICSFLNPLSTNLLKWSNTLKQFVGCKLFITELFYDVNVLLTFLSNIVVMVYCQFSTHARRNWKLYRISKMKKCFRSFLWRWVNSSWRFLWRRVSSFWKYSSLLFLLMSPNKKKKQR